MFKVYQYGQGHSSFYIARGLGNYCYEYLHSGGNIYATKECWPTRELAQAVLDKHQPPHVWEHGDVFRHQNKQILLYIQVHGRFHQVVGFNAGNGGYSWNYDVGMCLRDATFLFNIREKL